MSTEPTIVMTIVQTTNFENLLLLDDFFLFLFSIYHSPASFSHVAS